MNADWMSLSRPKWMLLAALAVLLSAFGFPLSAPAQTPVAWQVPKPEVVKKAVFDWLDARKADAAVRAKADALWAVPPDPSGGELLSRVVETFALADDDARKLLAVTNTPRDPKKAPPAPWKANPGMAPLEAGNLRLWYARWLVQESFYRARTLRLPPKTSPWTRRGCSTPPVSHSGSIGYSTGPYVLSLLVQPIKNPPRVIETNPSPGGVLTEAPTQITVQFSEPVDISQIALAAYNQTGGNSAVQAVFIEGQNGSIYYPRFDSFDAATNTATFLMLDRLPSGSYASPLGRRGTDRPGRELRWWETPQVEMLSSSSR